MTASIEAKRRELDAELDAIVAGLVANEHLTEESARTVRRPITVDVSDYREDPAEPLPGIPRQQ